MFKLKLINKPKMMKLKCNFTFPNVVLANLQEKETTPTKEIQQIKADQQYDGLSKVVVNAIPDEYIIPNGDINIIENGTYDVTDKINAIVNIPEKKLGSKIIIENGTYKAADDNLDGYSEVEVATSGVDINEYFSDTISGGSSSSPGFLKTIKKIRSPLTINGTDASYMFYNYNLGELPQIDTSNVTNMKYMFSNSKATILDLSNFDTSKVTNMGSMFSNSAATILDLSSFDTSNVTDMSYMFTNCKATTIDLSSFDTSNVTDMSYMFKNCKATTIDLSNFDASNVTNVYMMFADSQATTIDLSSFNASKATSTNSMFENSKVTTLDIRNFDFTNVKNYNNMFRNVSANCLIIVKDDTAKEWITSKFTTLTNVKTIAEYEL